MGKQSGSITVTPDELKNASGLITDKKQEFVRLYNELYREVDTMNSNWQGEANLQYKQQIDEFRKEFQNVEKVLGGYAEFLLKASTVYATTEKNIKDGARKLTT